MIDQKYLDILRCPLDPTRETRLILDDIKVICERCRVQFKSREGFISLVPEEAVLPENCPSLDKLPCQNVKSERRSW